MVLSGTIGADWVHFGELWFVWVQSGLFGYVRFKPGQNGQTDFCVRRVRAWMFRLRYATLNMTGDIHTRQKTYTVILR